MGPKPLSLYFEGWSKGVELSPVERKRVRSAPNAMEPPVWQQMLRCEYNCRMIFSDFRSNLPSLNTNRERRFTEVSTGE